MTKDHRQKCHSGAKIAFLGEKEMSKIYKCTLKLATKFNVKDIEVLSEKQICEEYCLQSSCTLLYQINYRKYVPSCQQRTLQQKRFKLCQMDKLNKEFKNKSYSNYNVVVLLVISFIFALSLSVLTYLYRRHKTTNRSESVS